MKNYYVINHAFEGNPLLYKIWCADYSTAVYTKTWWAKRGGFPEIITKVS